jgi:hypothetical protein
MSLEYNAKRAMKVIYKKNKKLSRLIDDVNID